MSLIDIEVLAERVRGARARSFISEAVACYKAGAYRSCIVATWVALIYDFVDKFRELALSGDAAAKALVAEFDRIQRERDTAAALKFEREVLDIAKGTYELISVQECVDLRRLFDDRNRYGHPNINQDSDALDATPELARTHLRAAVEHVMQRPPVQGKVALSSIRAAVESPYFPSTASDALVALSATPLLRAKKVVVTEFYLGCISSLIREKLNANDFEARLAAAQATRTMHRAAVDEVVASKLLGIFEKTPDDCLDWLVILLAKDPDLASLMSPALVIRLRKYIEQLEDKKLGVVNFAGRISALSEAVSTRVSKVTAMQLRDFVQRVSATPVRSVVERALELLETSRNWDSSNAVLGVIEEKMADLLTPSDAVRVLAANTNAEVKWAFSFPSTIKKLAVKGLLTAGQITAQVAADGGDGHLADLSI